MKLYIPIFSLFLLVACSTSEQNKLKENFVDIEKIAWQKPESHFIQSVEAGGDILGDTKIFDHAAKGYILVYPPTLSDMNAFEHPLHLAGMYTYFESEKGKKVETIFVSNEDKAVFDEFIARNQKEHPEFYKSLSFLHDAKGELIKKLDIDADHLSHGGVAILYDEKGEEIFREIDYKCQGEKLQRMYQYFNPRKTNFAKTNYEIEVGEKVPPALAPHCTEYLGQKNMLITFYPAPLSHSCSIQMRTLSDMATQNLESKDLKVVAISIGSLEQVAAWETHQPVKSIELKADVTGEISNAFNSLLTDEHGITYSDRTVFLIDKTGTVRYINKDYDVTADLDVLEQEILKL